MQASGRIAGASIAAATVAAMAHVAWRLNRRRPKGIPTIPGHWLLGNFLEFYESVKTFTHLDILVQWHKMFGDVFVLYIPTMPPIIETIDPRDVKHVLKTRFDNYVKGTEFHDRLHDLLGEGIFNVDGHSWYSQRKTAGRMFTDSKFKNHIWSVVHGNCEKLVNLLKQQEGKGTIDVFNIMNRFTLDTIGEVGFGRTIASLHNAESPLLQSFDRAQQICVKRFMLPFWRLRRFFRLGGESDAHEHFSRLREYSGETVGLLKAKHEKGDVGDSFVGLFLKAAATKGEHIDDEFLKDLVLNFVIAGRDTTAQALSWCFYLLARHPDAERKLLEEISQVCQNGDLTYDGLEKLKYTQAVVNEALRLYPSVPFDSKEAVGDDVLPSGAVVRKGCMLLYNPYAMGRSEKLWGKDAHQFKPERWLDVAFPSLYTYPVFNAGPRECLGKRLAWVEMKACLVQVLKAVKISLAIPPEGVLCDVQLTIGMSSGLPCHIQSR